MKDKLNPLLDIWIDISSNISFTIILIVIATGYLVRALKVFPKWNLTLKIGFFALLPSLIFTFINKDVNYAMWFVSYFVAFGMHTVLVKWFEKKTGLSNKL